MLNFICILGRESDIGLQRESTQQHISISNILMYIFIVLSTTFVKYKFILQKTKLDKQPNGPKKGELKLDKKLLTYYI